MTRRRTDLRFAKARGLLDALAMCGHRVRRDGKQIIVNAPRGALSADDRRELAAYKAELLVILEEDQFTWSDAP